VTHKSVISPVQRNIRELRFTRPLREKVVLRASMSLPLLNLGLCKSSSGSAMSGDKFEPHCLGSGWRENCERRSMNTGGTESDLTLSEMEVNFEIPPAVYGDSDLKKRQ